MQHDEDFIQAVSRAGVGYIELLFYLSRKILDDALSRDMPYLPGDFRQVLNCEHDHGKDDLVALQVG